MASGDVVSDMYTTTTSFQPAVGVSICITQFLTWNDTAFIKGKGDIDTNGYPLTFTSSTGHNTDMRFWNGFVQKFFINNDSYLEFVPSADPNSHIGFLGIEI
jgi:hypothetical protein